MQCSNISVSNVTSISFYITGVIVGSSFGFVAGILFLAVVFMIKKIFSNKEKKIVSDNIPASEADGQQTNGAQSASTFQA